MEVTLEEALRLATKYKAQVVKVGGIEVHMSPLAFVDAADVPREAQKVGAEHGSPTADELLMWSAGGPLPEVHATPPKEEA